MPHGKMVLFPTFTLSIASVLSLLTLINCDFMEGDSDIADQVGYSFSLTSGLMPACISVPQYGADGILLDEIADDIRDDPIRIVSLSFALVACILGATMTILLWPITYKLYKTKWITAIAIVVAFCGASQLVTLIMLQSDYCKLFGPCKLSDGGIISMVAAFLWLVGAVGVWAIPVQNESDGGNGVSSERLHSSARSIHPVDDESEKPNDDDDNDVEAGIEKN